MNQTYSLKKGLGKALVGVLAAIGAVLALAGFSDITIVALIQDHIFPLLGTLTAGGAVVMAVNAIKFYFF